MIKRNKIVSLIISVAIIFAVLFSALFIIQESGHKCAGNDCQICCQLNSCLTFFKNTSSKPVSFEASLVIAFAAVLVLGIKKDSNKVSTPVDLKIKLSN